MIPDHAIQSLFDKFIKPKIGLTGTSVCLSCIGVRTPEQKEYFRKRIIEMNPNLTCEPIPNRIGNYLFRWKAVFGSDSISVEV